MKKFLLISYAFPPAGGAGVQRPVKLVKYIERFGWKPVVVTAQNPSAPTSDPSLEGDIPDAAVIHRIPTLEPAGKAAAEASRGGGLKPRLAALAKRLLFPDRHVLWLLTALAPAIKIARREKIEAVMVTAPPFSSFILGSLAARLNGLPLILDFRDEWSGFYSRGFSGPQASKTWGLAVTGLERRLVQGAAAVTAASYPYCERFGRLYGMANKCNWIPNGFDPDDFPARPQLAARPGAKLNLAYLGTVTPVTSLGPFWKALEALPRQARQRLEVDVVGRIAPSEPMPGLARGVEVRVHGYLPHRKALGFLQRADALVITLADMPGVGRIIPGKAYEYLAGGKPILGIMPQGVCSALLKANSGAMLFKPGDIAGISRAVGELVEQKASDGRIQAAPSQSWSIFSRVKTAALFAHVLNTVTQGQPSGQAGRRPGKP